MKLSGLTVEDHDLDTKFWLVESVERPVPYEPLFLVRAVGQRAEDDVTASRAPLCINAFEHALSNCLSAYADLLDVPQEQKCPELQA